MQAHKDIVYQILFSLLAAMFLFSAGTKFIGVKKVVEMFSDFKLSAYRHFAGLVESSAALLFLFPCTQILGALVASCYLGACFLPGLQFNKRQVVIPSAGTAIILWAVVMLKIHFG
jgi:hypothetical protein